MIRSMLVATDGSETAGKAVERAAELARRIHARVHVMTAYDPFRGTRVSAGTSIGPELADWRFAADSLADAVLDQACATMRLAGVDAQRHARNGHPADAILDLAEELEVDLVVVGSKGMTGGRRWLLGSVPDKVSHHAPCCVLIVHTA
jgi:nucleotide-binding universal stress UspA family protein